MEYENDEEQEESPSGINQIELLRSYAAYVARAVRKRRVGLAVAFVLIAGLTAGIVALLPPTYHCEMKLTAIRNQVFEDDSRGNILGGAREIVMRRESLVALIKRADLVKRWDQDSPHPPFQIFASWRASRAPRSATTTSSTRWSTPSASDLASKPTTSRSPLGSTGPAPRPRPASSTPPSKYSSKRATEKKSPPSKSASPFSTSTQAPSAKRFDTIAEQLEHLRTRKLAQAAKGLGNQEASGASSAAPTTRSPFAASRAPVRPTKRPCGSKKSYEKKKAIADLEADRARRLVEAEGKLEEMRDQDLHRCIPPRSRPSTPLRRCRTSPSR